MSTRNLIFVSIVGLIGLTTSVFVFRPKRPGKSTPVPIPEKSTTETILGFDRPRRQDGVPNDWVATVRQGPMRVEVRAGPDGASVLWLRGENASFLLHRRLPPIKAAAHPFVEWSWRAIQLPDRGDVRKSSLLFGENRNDQAVQLLVVFENKKVLSFVWDTTAPVDTEVAEPSLVGEVRTHVMDSGTTGLGKWQRHRVDLDAEYVHRFGGTSPSIVGVALQCNSNHTASTSEGEIGPIILHTDR